MTQIRKYQFWLDNRSGTLTEYTTDLNQVDLERTVDILENTHLTQDDRSIVSGIRSAKIPLNGYDNDSTTSMPHTLALALGTSISKTFSFRKGTRYYTGECFPAGLKLSGDGKKLGVFSVTLEVDDSVTSTTVAPT